MAHTDPVTEDTTAVDSAGLAPLPVRVRFCHAAVERVARGARVQILHIKGPAAHPSLRDRSRTGSDADVIVRPDQATRLVDALLSAGWSMRARFATGSVFEHAATLWHVHWGYVDVHRAFPGVGVPAEVAFGRMWRDRRTIDLAGVACAVPSVPAQALLHILHEARERLGEQHGADVRSAWVEADPDLRAAVAGLRDELRAEVAFAAATGGLERYQDHPEYRLWRHMRFGGSRLDEWRSRFAAAPSRRRALVVIARSLRANTDHLAMDLGREPTRRERRAAELRRVRTVVRDLTRLVRPRGSR